MQHHHTAIRMLSGILVASTLAVGLAVGGAQQPARASAFATPASCTADYHFAPVARELGAAPITNVAGTPLGFMWASLWVRYYVDTHGKFVSCGTYYLTVRVCAVDHGTLPIGEVRGFIADDATGVTGYGAANFIPGDLSNGACQVYTGDETWPGDIDPGAAVHGIAHFSSVIAGSGTVTTGEYIP